MAITFVGKGTGQFSSGAITLVPNASTVVGQTMIAAVETNNAAITISGWTEAVNSPQLDATDSHRITMFWRRFTGTDNFATSDSGDHQIGNIWTFDGVIDTGDPFNITAGAGDSASTTTGAIPGAITTVDACMIVAVCGTGRDGNSSAEFSSWANAALASITEGDDLVNSTGGGGGFGMAYGIKAVAGDYGTTSVTLTTATRKGMWSGALTPLSTGATLGHRRAGRTPSGVQGVRIY